MDLGRFRNHATALLVVGIGDGVLDAIQADPVCRQKTLYALALPGEAADERAFTVRCWDDLIPWITGVFGQHHQVPQLATIDVLDDHPLCPEAEAWRTAHRERLYRALGDQGVIYGNDVVDSAMGFIHAARNAPVLLAAPALHDHIGALSCPVISIAAGPSLRMHLDALRALQDRCLLVACDAVLEGLLREGIVPHLCTPLERLRQLAPLSRAAKGTRVRFAGLPVCHPDTIACYDQHLYVQAADRVYAWLAREDCHTINSGSSTGVLSAILGIALTTGPVYLVGHDLSRGPAAESHSDLAAAAAADLARVLSPAEAAEEGTGYERRLLPGNGGGLVESMFWWEIFRGELASNAWMLAQAGRRMVNVNAWHKVGAVIEHTVAEPLPDPATLPVLEGPFWKAPAIDRVEAWRHRSRHCGDDAHALIDTLSRLRADVQAAMAEPPPWPTDALCERLNLHKALPEASADAFGYVLRSCLWSCMTLAHHRCKRASPPERVGWITLESLDSTCAVLVDIMRELMPLWQEVAGL